jgi:glycosyltransferase involved in cell wall biosynthesis
MQNQLSVVITHLDDPEGLWHTIQGLRIELANEKLEYEIIISDGGSVQQQLDLVRVMVKNFRDFGVNISLIENSINLKGCAGVRTAGILKAKYDIVCFMDGHIHVDNSYFKKQLALFKDPDVYVAYAPMAYWAQLLYEYTLNQVYFGQSTNTWNAVSNKPYPVAGACPCCTLVRRDILKLFFPEDEMKDIAYTMDEPSFAIRCWMFGKKVLFNPNTFHAHSYFRHSGRGDFNFERAKPKAAYALAGQELANQVMKEWKTYDYVPDYIFNPPIKDREFVEKNAKVKHKDLENYLIKQGVKR